MSNMNAVIFLSAICFMSACCSSPNPPDYRKSRVRVTTEPSEKRGGMGYTTLEDLSSSDVAIFIGTWGAIGDTVIIDWRNAYRGGRMVMRYSNRQAPDTKNDEESKKLW